MADYSEASSYDGQRDITEGHCMAAVGGSRNYGTGEPMRLPGFRSSLSLPQPPGPPASRFHRASLLAAEARVVIGRFHTAFRAKITQLAGLIKLTRPLHTHYPPLLVCWKSC